MICRAVELNYRIITCSGLPDVSINYSLRGYEPFWRALSSSLIAQLSFGDATQA